MCDCMYMYKKSLKIPKGYWEVAIQTNTKTQWSNEHNTSNGRQNTTQRVRIKKKEKQGNTTQQVLGTTLHKQTQGTQDEDKQDKNRTQYVLDTTMRTKHI